MMSRISLTTSDQFVGRDGQVANAFSGSVINGVGNRCGDARDPNLSHAAGADRIKGEIGFANESDIDLGYVCVGRHVVIREVPDDWQSSGRIVGSLFHQGHAYAHGHAAKDLAPSRLRANDSAAIHHAHYSRHLHAWEKRVDFYFAEMRAPRLECVGFALLRLLFFAL